jgi:hypothetical protein
VPQESVLSLSRVSDVVTTVDTDVATEKQQQRLYEASSRPKQHEHQEARDELGDGPKEPIR